MLNLLGTYGTQDFFRELRKLQENNLLEKNVTITGDTLEITFEIEQGELGQTTAKYSLTINIKDCSVSLVNPNANQQTGNSDNLQ